MKSPAKTPFGRRGTNSRGMALVVTLALVVLATITVMAFFTRATAHRSIESTRSNRILAWQVVESGADYVTASLLREIETNSTLVGTTYLPTTNAFAVPQRPLPSAWASGADFANLLRRSVNEATNGVGETNASTHRVTDPSANGRVIPLADWNSPALLGGSGFTDASQLPNWIYLNRDGSTTATPTANAIGRFAYTVYDQGGLLDANVAGHPASADPASLRGTLAAANLSQLPGLSGQGAAIDQLVDFRNPGAAPNYPAFAHQAAHGGFLLPRTDYSGGIVTNNFFASRQDLLRYARTKNTPLTNALPQLTHFSRVSTGPTWTPLTPDGSTVDYAAAANATTGTNRFLPNVLVTAEFTRADGTLARVGDPLLKTPFPLARLSAFAHGSSGINPNGKTLVNGQTVAATTSTIQRDFGLRRQGRTWVYEVDGSSEIKRLGEIGGREPNFFELLKAGILSGSLHKTLLTAGPVPDFDRLPDSQIFQIGANIIDQYDADSYPTRVDGGGGYFFGLENLPYLTKVVDIVRRYEENETVGTNAYIKPRIGVWFSPVVWNPHAGATNLPTANAPTQFRFVLEGSAYAVAEGSLGPSVSFREDPADGIKFNASTLFQTPVMLDGKDGRPGSTDHPPANPDPAASGNKDNQSARPGFGFIGISVGDAIAPDSRLNPGVTWPRRYVGAHKNPGLRGKLQYLDGSTWVNYNELKFIPRADNLTFDEAMNQFRGYNPRAYADNADPRIIRLGAPDTYGYGLGIGLTTPAGYVQTEGRTARPDDGQNQGEQWVHPDRLSALAAGWTRAANPAGVPGWPATAAYFGHLSDNKTNSPTRYLDNDNVQRRGDGAYSTPGNTPAMAAGKPLRTDNFDSRPHILNRPFRSVAELGYASRGLPWKHLDFFTTESADAALLDVFSLDEAPALVAGRVNLNTRQAPVLEALLAGTTISDTGTNAISSADAGILAQALVSRTSDPARGPLRDRSELVTQFAQDVALTNPDDAVIKQRREAAIRALADVADTRTWSLFIDVVAQTGRFGPGSGALSADRFVVEGEARQWVSVAIDRPTGKILQRSTEAVNE